MQKAVEPENDAGFPKHNYSSKLRTVVIHTPLSLDYSVFLGCTSMVSLSGYTHYGNSACEGSSPYQLKMAAPAEVSKKCSNFRIRQFYEKRHFNIAANLTLNTMVSFIILFNRAYCQNSVSGRTDRMTDRIKWVELARNRNKWLGRTRHPYIRAVHARYIPRAHVRANTEKMRDRHLVARTCDNEVGVAISIRDPYTSPFTSRYK